MTCSACHVVPGVVLAGLVHGVLMSWVLWLAGSSTQQLSCSYSLLLLLPFSVVSVLLAYMCVLAWSALCRPTSSSGSCIRHEGSKCSLASAVQALVVQPANMEQTTAAPMLSQRYHNQLQHQHVVLHLTAAAAAGMNPQPQPNTAVRSQQPHTCAKPAMNPYTCLDTPSPHYFNQCVPKAVQYSFGSSNTGSHKAGSAVAIHTTGTSSTSPATTTTSSSSSSSSGGGVIGVEDEPIDVWILAGQSNCVGSNGPDGQVMPEAAAPWPGKILAWNNREGTWQDAVPNVHLHVYGYEDAYSCGPDMAFARTLIELGVSSKVGLIPTALGATNLYDQWRPGGVLWCNMMNYTMEAMTALGNEARLKGLIWIQGESDATNTVKEALSYGDELTAWLEATRSGLAAFHPQLPLVMVIMSTRKRHYAFPFIDVVRSQQQALQLPNVLKIDMAGYEFFEQDFYGHEQLIHLSKSGCCAMGVAMAYEVALKLPPS